MAGVAIEVNAGEVDALLDEMIQRCGDLSPVMAAIGEVNRTQIIGAFEDGTTPGGQAWLPSRRAMEDGGETLVDKAILRNSINVASDHQEVSVGTNVVYAAIHNFGGKAGRGGRVTLPARRFMPEESELDWDEFGEMVRLHVMGVD